jgi:hypothetical protein
MSASNLAAVDREREVAASAVGFEPYIPASANIRELTMLPLIVGTLLGAIFGASSLYLVLKVGLTVSASIPVAVISITLFRPSPSWADATRRSSRTTSCRRRDRRGNRLPSASASRCRRS